MNTEERLKRLFEASPEQSSAIDSILEGKTLKAPESRHQNQQIKQPFSEVTYG